MSWLRKSMSAKAEKNMFFMFQQRQRVWFFPVCSFLPENTNLYVLQTKSAAVALWRSLYLPENVKTQQAPGWQSHLTSPPPSPVLHWQHCSIISSLYFSLECKRGFTAIFRLDRAGDEVKLKIYSIYSFIPISYRLTWTRQFTTFRACALCWNILIYKVE